MILKSHVKSNLIANFGGKAWTVIMNLAFIPLYIRFMGIEAYGLIGVFISVMAILSILDMGLSTTLNRELARQSNSNIEGRKIRNLVRTLEIVYWAIGIVLGLGLLVIAPLAAHHWMNPENLSLDTIAQAFMLMGLVVACQWPAALYTGGLQGLQHQVMLNVIIAINITIKNVGAVLILWLVQPTIQAFFIWHAVASAIHSVLLAICLWCKLPPSGHRSMFSKQLLFENWRFTAGMTGISITTVLLTQLDKVVLSRLLTLDMFGYYTLAASVATVSATLISPIFSALFPRFSQLVADGRQVELKRLYHQGCQFASVIVLPVSITLAFFSFNILSIWLKDSITAEHSYIILSLLSIGSMFNSLVVLPFALQIAHGWTRLSLIKNFVAVALLSPAMILMAQKWGSIGAAIAWIALNMGYFFIEIPIMHRRLLKGAMVPWYLVDVGRPLVIVVITLGLARLLMSNSMPMHEGFLYIVTAAFLSLVLSGMSTPVIRDQFRIYLHRKKV